MMNNFVYLKEQNCSINLAHITFVEWDVATRDEQGQVSRITTVSMSGGDGFFLGERDSWLLRKAIQDFNAREQAAGAALPALERICDALFWLAGVGYEHPQSVTGVVASEAGSSGASAGNEAGANSQNSAGNSGTSHEDAGILGVKANRQHTGVIN